MRQRGLISEHIEGWEIDAGEGVMLQVSSPFLPLSLSLSHPPSLLPPSLCMPSLPPSLMT